MYIVKVLHHPDQLIPSQSTSINLSPREKLYLNVRKTYVQGLLEYFGEPGYDVTPYNQRSFVVLSIPPRTIPVKLAVELIKKADKLNYGDELTNVLFSDSGKVIATLTVWVKISTFDYYDPRNIKDWPEIAKRVTGITLLYKGREYDAVALFAVKYLHDRISEVKMKPEYVKDVETAYRKVKDAIIVLTTLSDDLVTYLLREKVSDRNPLELLTYVFDFIF